MGRWEPSPFHPYSLPQPFHWRGVAGPEIGEAGLYLSSALSSCVDEDAQRGQTKSSIVCKMHQSSFLLLSCVSTNHGLLLLSVSTPGLCIRHLDKACIWKCLLLPPSPFPSSLQKQKMEATRRNTLQHFIAAPQGRKVLSFQCTLLSRKKTAGARHAGDIYAMQTVPSPSSCNHTIPSLPAFPPLHSHSAKCPHVVGSPVEL